MSPIIAYWLTWAIWPTCWIPSQCELACPSQVDILTKLDTLIELKGKDLFRLTNMPGGSISPDAPSALSTGGRAI
jgi:hypothetical protein